MKSEKDILKQYTYYLIFMLVACSGAFIWQFIFPTIGNQFTSWGSNTGWQREIALWNIGIIGAIILSITKKNIDFMRIISIQSTILCLLLGANHLISLIQNFSISYIIHIMGIVEVLLIGGIWGVTLLYNVNKKTTNN